METNLPKITQLGLLELILEFMLRMRSKTENFLLWSNLYSVLFSFQSKPFLSLKLRCHIFYTSLCLGVSISSFLLLGLFCKLLYKYQYVFPLREQILKTSCFVCTLIDTYELFLPYVFSISCSRSAKYDQIWPIACFLLHRVLIIIFALLNGCVK